MLGLALAYRRALLVSSDTSGRAAKRRRLAAGVAGIALVWVVLDWPIGPLGAGYLASVHMLQFLVLALVAPPLLLIGLPPAWENRLGPRTEAVLALATRPLGALIGFNVIVFATHLPVVVDALMVSQAGAFVLDLAWLAGGLAFWWPVIRAAPRPRLRAGAGLAYLFGGMGPHMGIGMVLAIVPWPLYGIYELAPPVGSPDPLGDQQRAAGLMLFGDVVVGLIALAFLLDRWRREEEPRTARAAGG